MASINQADGQPVIDYMARDYESLLNAMREQIPRKLPEWSSYASEADFGNVLLELFAHIGDILSFYQDRVANESFLGTAQTRRSAIEHLRLIGYELATAAPAAADLTLSVPGSVTASVTVNRGDAFATQSQKNTPSARFEYTGAQLTIDFAGRVDPGSGLTVYQPGLTVDPGTGRKVYAPLPVEEGRLFTDELLGVSDGTPDQRFTLARTGLILRPPGAAQPFPDVAVRTTLGGTVQAWTLQETLAFSQSGQQDFAVQVDADNRATIVFGDGTFGAKPPAGATVTATYRTGGGAPGNVPIAAISTILDAPQLALQGATVTNLAAASGGAERETVAHAVQHAPAVFRSLRRAVTAADYEQLALSFKGVAKVRAVATGWNEVTLYVAPEGLGSVNDVLESGLKAYFEDKRMIGQVIQVADVNYIAIQVTVMVQVDSYYVRNDVVTRVQQAAARLLAFDRVGFGVNVYLSKFYEQCQEVSGVVYIDIQEFRRGDQAGPGDPLVQAGGVISLGPNESPVIPANPDYAAGLKVLAPGTQ